MQGEILEILKVFGYIGKIVKVGKKKSNTHSRDLQ